ncbi:hypothetical protein [Nostoc sp. MS1]|uniref:hypothetical protein n=1 Tax=Nostoc sp. MS1 TaxID=2764711 RepID=UPI001CC6C40F|nr:hypothetical protein [Nostoc sp. MS1]
MSSDYRYSYSSVYNQSETAVKPVVDKILRAGKLSPEDHALLTSVVLNHTDISEAERRQINRIFDHIQTGQLKLTDW